MENKYYTYIWLREDGTPYYVGKGHGKRGFENKNHRQHCPPVERIIINHWHDEETAYAFDMYIIDFYGRKDLGTGCLRNLTDGGENPPIPTKWNGCKTFLGKHHTAETKRKIADKRIGRFSSEETKTKISEASKGNKNAAGNKNCIGRKYSEESKRKISEAVKRSWNAKRSNSTRGTGST